MMGSRALLSAFFGGMLTLPSMCNVYKSDVGKLCDAEQLSQGSYRANKLELFNWMERNVGSSEGIILVRNLEAKDAHGISNALRDEARKVELPSCTLADQAETQAKDDDFHTDLANLCAGSALRDDNSTARLDIAGAEDAERMREITLWTNTNFKSQEARAIIAKMASLAPQQRPAYIKAEAAKVGVAPCGLVAVLAAAPPAPVPVMSSQARPNFALTRIDAPVKAQEVIVRNLTTGVLPGQINNCYAVALASTPTLAGKLVMNVTFDKEGHAAVVTDDGSTMPGTVISCVTSVLQQLSMGSSAPAAPPSRAGHSKPTAGGPTVPIKAGLTLDCTPSTVGPGYGAIFALAKPGGATGPGRHH